MTYNLLCPNEDIKLTMIDFAKFTCTTLERLQNKCS